MCLAHIEIAGLLIDRKGEEKYIPSAHAIWKIAPQFGEGNHKFIDTLVDGITILHHEPLAVARVILHQYIKANGGANKDTVRFAPKNEVINRIFVKDTVAIGSDQAVGEDVGGKEFARFFFEINYTNGLLCCGLSIGNDELHISNSKFLLLHEHLDYITEVGEVDVGVRRIVGIAKYLKRGLYEKRYRAWSNGTGNATEFAGVANGWHI